jgi:hypothetical protein
MSSAMLEMLQPYNELLEKIDEYFSEVCDECFSNEHTRDTDPDRYRCEHQSGFARELAGFELIREEFIPGLRDKNMAQESSDYES